MAIIDFINCIDIPHKTIFNTLNSTIKDAIITLHGKLEGVFSVSINITYRITMDFIIEDGKIILLDVGHHDELFKNYLVNTEKTKFQSP